MPLETLTAVASALTAVVGLFVAVLAYRGFRRNDSPTMRALSIGIVCIAVVPYLILYLVGPAVDLADAEALLAITLSHTVGLAAIYRTFQY
ncbi:DUF7521 family protein [Natrarchaeobius chitinivorans]|uniref:Uncharacterized protein n=1 Tax=Natrarchaeobius chitinivorans TaxID=1679083 RepID=A0A3N6P7A4_NATCH|nr:hypothetical protein [Natrarchaeobius chitinivorans]RQG91825.1 hypothetical protein EA473_18710 [Natrarchaeobius chitinivorans]